MNLNRNAKLCLFLLVFLLSIPFFEYTNLLIIGKQEVSTKNVNFPYLFNLILLLQIQGILFFIFGNLFISSLLTILLYGSLSIVNAFKIQFLNSPLFISDFYWTSIQTAFGVLGGLGNKFLLYFTSLVFIVFCFSFLIQKLYFYFSMKESYFTRMAYLLFSSFLSIVFLTSSPSLEKKIFQLFRVQNFQANNRLFYQTSGLLVGLFVNLKSNWKNHSIEDYSKEKILNLLETISIQKIKRTEKPDVIIFLAESFWDPLEFDLEVTPDPIPFFHSMQKKSGGQLVVPAFGGGTVLSEFEILTGLSTQFIYGFPYTAAIYKPIPSLGSIFQEAGYRTLYIHAFEGWFYDRKRVLPLLGFNEFQDIHSIKKYFLNSEEIFDSRYLKDQFFFQKLNYELEKTSPVFLFASNYSTHGPFTENEKSSLFTVSSKLTESQKKKLISNLILLNQLDRELEIFCKKLHYRNKPFLLFAFGDHLPNENYLGFSLKNHSTGLEKSFSTPYFWISNSKLKLTQEKISLNYFTSSILENTNIPIPEYLQIIRKIQKKIPVFSALKKTNQSTEYSFELPENFSEQKKVLELIQYDILFGNQYLLQKK